MPVLNKHFWKIAMGFLGILAFAVGALLGFEYWRGYEEEKELKTLLKEVDRQEYEFNRRQKGEAQIPAPEDSPKKLELRM